MTQLIPFSILVCLLKKKEKEKERAKEIKDVCLLGLEVICSQFGVVNLEQDVGIANGGSGNL